MKDKEKIFVTNNFRETQKLGKEFVSLINNRIIALYGNLGSGKTTFVQGLAKGLGIKRRIISPTFIIIRSYKLKMQISKLFYHIDLYRIEDEEGIKSLGIEEIIRDPQNIVAIEWAEKIRELLPQKRWDITFEFVNENKRRVDIKFEG